MQKNKDKSVVFTDQEFIQLHRLVKMMQDLLDKIPSVAAPNIKMSDIQKIDYWAEKLEEIRKQKV